MNSGIKNLINSEYTQKVNLRLEVCNLSPFNELVLEKVFKPQNCYNNNKKSLNTILIV